MSDLRVTINALLRKGAFASAAALADHLSATTFLAEDYLLLATCFQSMGQHRRSLVVLEQNGQLSAEKVGDLARWLSVGDPADSTHIAQLSVMQCAAQSLLALGEYEDCVYLLQPIVNVGDDASSLDEAVRLVNWARSSPAPSEFLGFLAVLYCIAGRCFDALEHRARAKRALCMCVRLDPAVIEAAELLVDRGLLTPTEKEELVGDVSAARHSGSLSALYRTLLATEAHIGEPAELGQSWLAICAERRFEQHQLDAAYRLSRLAHSKDPYNPRSLAVYIACLAVLRLKSELFYLGHELVNSAPKNALSWYAVGSYYWSCGKMDQAQKHLVKATKLDKTLAKGWVLLGHVLAAQEESEQAISAYRTAARLLPGDHRPVAYIAKELSRTGHSAPALHMLASALELSPEDPALLNELGVTYMQQGSLDLALQYFERAVQALDAISSRGQSGHSEGSAPEICLPPSIQPAGASLCGAEVFSNYATALRRCERFEEALHWYDKCMAVQPNDANCHAAVAFTFHLMQRFDLAISSYHQALALDPSLAFCADMLNRAMEDASLYPSVGSGDPQEEAVRFANFTRHSRYHLGPDPVASGELSAHADETNRSFGRGLGAVDTSVAEDHHAHNISAFSGFPSEMYSPGFSLAASFSKIEGRLSISQWDVGSPQGMAQQEGSFYSQQSYRSDNGGYLEDSFQS